MKICTIAYLPPPSFRGADTAVFLENLKRFPTQHPLILFSDHQWPNTDLIKLPSSPEVAKDFRDAKGASNPWAVNNLIFFTALRIALRNEFTHILYLEADCRVGKKAWDNIVFEEYFSHPNSLACGGTLVTYNPANSGAEGFKRWNNLMERNTRRNFKVACYGFLKARLTQPAAQCFPMAPAVSTTLLG
jgi:hypothetical protein